MIEITSTQDPRISEFLTLKDKSAKLENYIICESEKVFHKLMKTDLQIHKVYSHSEFLKENQEHLPENTEVYFSSKELLKEVVGYNAHHGVLIKAQRPNLKKLEELGDKIIVLNGITSPENCGAIVRNAAGFHTHSMIIDDKTVSPYLKRCIRVSTGNIFSQKVHHTYNLPGTLVQLKEKGYQILATANQEGAIDLKDFQAPDKYALVIGSEGHGIAPKVLEISDSILKISVDDTVEHLNAACSSGIFLYALN